MSKKKGIILKTFLFSFSLMTFIIVLIFSIFYFALPNYYRVNKIENFQSNSNALVNALKDINDAPMCADIILKFSTENNFNVIPLDKSGKVIQELTTSMLTVSQVQENFFKPESDLIKKVVPDSSEAEKLHEQSLSDLSRNNSGMIVSLESVVEANSELKLFFEKEVENSLINYIVINGSLQPVNEVKMTMFGLIPYTVIGGTIISFGFSLWFSKKLTRPILELTNTARQMEQLKPNAIATVYSNDELGELSDCLNELYKKLMLNIEELSSKAEKFQKLEQSKADFMRSAGHELKTPISAISGILESMIDGIGDYKNYDKYLPICKNQVDRLTKLIQDILTAASENTDSLSILEPVDIYKILTTVIGYYAHFIKEKELNIKIEPFELFYTTNKKMLMVIFSNLISNAVMYTPKGGDIQIYFKNNILTIENTCIPIPANELERLFEAFYIMDYSRSRSISGNGLGLYIVKRYLEALALSYTLENSDMGFKFSIFIKE